MLHIDELNETLQEVVHYLDVYNEDDCDYVLRMLNKDVKYTINYMIEVGDYDEGNIEITLFIDSNNKLALQKDYVYEEDLYVYDNGFINIMRKYTSEYILNNIGRYNNPTENTVKIGRYDEIVQYLKDEFKIRDMNKLIEDVEYHCEFNSESKNTFELKIAQVNDYFRTDKGVFEQFMDAYRTMINTQKELFCTAIVINELGIDSKLLEKDGKEYGLVNIDSTEVMDIVDRFIEKYNDLSEYVY